MSPADRARNGVPPPPAPDADAETLRIDRALRGISSLDRNIFLVSRLDNMPYDEIAWHTGLSVKQVERRVLKAMLRMRRVQGGERPRWWWRLF